MLVNLSNDHVIEVSLGFYSQTNPNSLSYNCTLCSQIPFSLNYARLNQGENSQCKMSSDRPKMSLVPIGLDFKTKNITVHSV